MAPISALGARTLNPVEKVEETLAGPAKVICAALLLTPLLTGACAVAPELRGVSGPVTWEVADVRQTLAPDRSTIRWSYVIVLKETAGVGIRFETLEVGSPDERVEKVSRTETFQYRIDPNAELRVPRFYEIFFVPGQGPSFDESVPGGRGGGTVLYQFRGKDDTGKAVRVDVRVRLDPSLGK